MVGAHRATNVLTAATLAASSVLLWSVVTPGQQGRTGSVSVGNPNDGKLVGGVRLPDRGPGYASNPGTTNRDAKYGTDELVEAIRKIGADVERLAPGATLVVNDLGLENGGPIPHHQSHQAGRDVDILFYLLDPAGHVVRPRAVHIDRAGQGVFDGLTRDDPSDDTKVVLDVRRNWIVLRSLVESSDAALQRVFVSEGVRALLIEHARAERQPAWIIERAGEVMCEPEVPHDDHFHVRLFCTDADYRLGCRDSWPIYPWRRSEMAAVGLADLETAIRRPLPPGRRHRRPHPRRSPGRLWCP